MERFVKALPTSATTEVLGDDLSVGEACFCGSGSAFMDCHGAGHAAELVGAQPPTVDAAVSALSPYLEDESGEALLAPAYDTATSRSWGSELDEALSSLETKLAQAWSWATREPWFLVLWTTLLGLAFTIGHIVGDHGRLPSLARLAEWAQVLGFPFAVATCILAWLAYRNSR